MSVPRQHQDALTARLQTMLEPITDADSRTLAEYITALLDQGPPSDLLDNLSEFLGDHTRPFVDAVSAMLLSGDYLPAHLRPAVPDVAPAPAPGPEPTAASSSNNIRSPSTRDHRDRSGDRIGDRSRDRGADRDHRDSRRRRSSLSRSRSRSPVSRSATGRRDDDYRSSHHDNNGISSSSLRGDRHQDHSHRDRFAPLASSYSSSSTPPLVAPTGGGVAASFIGAAAAAAAMAKEPSRLAPVAMSMTGSTSTSIPSRPNARGVCYTFRDTGRCNRPNCQFEHVKDALTGRLSARRPSDPSAGRQQHGQHHGHQQHGQQQQSGPPRDVVVDHIPTGYCTMAAVQGHFGMFGNIEAIRVLEPQNRAVITFTSPETASAIVAAHNAPGAASAPTPFATTTVFTWSMERSRGALPEIRPSTRGGGVARTGDSSEPMSQQQQQMQQQQMQQQQQQAHMAMYYGGAAPAPGSWWGAPAPDWNPWLGHAAAAAPPHHPSSYSDPAAAKAKVDKATEKMVEMEKMAKPLRKRIEQGKAGAPGTDERAKFDSMLATLERQRMDLVQSLLADGATRALVPHLAREVAELAQKDALDREMEAYMHSRDVAPAAPAAAAPTAAAGAPTALMPANFVSGGLETMPVRNSRMSLDLRTVTTVVVRGVPAAVKDALVSHLASFGSPAEGSVVVVEPAHPENPASTVSVVYKYAERTAAARAQAAALPAGLEGCVVAWKL